MTSDEEATRDTDSGSDPRRKPGPKPERLNLDFEDWREAVKEALTTERPDGGWDDEVAGSTDD